MYSEPWQMSKIEIFVRIVNGWKLSYNHGFFMVLSFYNLLFNSVSIWQFHCIILFTSTFNFVLSCDKKAVSSLIPFIKSFGEPKMITLPRGENDEWWGGGSGFRKKKKKVIFKLQNICILLYTSCLLFGYKDAKCQLKVTYDTSKPCERDYKIQMLQIFRQKLMKPI